MTDDFLTRKERNRLIDDATDQAMRRVRPEMDRQMRSVVERIGPRTIEVQKGPVTVVNVYNDGALKANVDHEGNAFFGSDIADPSTTSMGIFAVDQRYNNESMGRGDILIGDNSDTAANLKWDASEGRLDFRLGTTVTGFMDTDGTINIINGIFSGSITATVGLLGGFVIGATTIADAAGLVGLSSAVTAGNDVRIWAGNADPTIAPFSVTEDGQMVASAGQIGGFRIDVQALYSVSSDKGIYLDAALQLIKVGDLLGTYIEIDGANQRIRSSNYVAGFRGMSINAATGDAEFNNLVARGKIKTAVFEKDTISAISGTTAILNADVLAVDMTALDSCTITVDGDASFEVDDVLRIKDGIDDEWMQVTVVNGGNNYTVLRDQGATSPTLGATRTLSGGATRTTSDGSTRTLSGVGNYSADNNPAWKKGQAVVSYGKTGEGGVVLTSGVNPYISLFTHAGKPWETTTEHALLWKTGMVVGAGDVILDADGISFPSGNSGDWVSTSSLLWKRDGYMRASINNYQDTWAGEQVNVFTITASSYHPSDVVHSLLLQSGYPNRAVVGIELSTRYGYDHHPTISINSSWTGSGFTDVDTVIHGVDPNVPILYANAGQMRVWVGGIFGLNYSSEAVIAGGVATITSSYAIIDTEDGAATDNLDYLLSPGDRGDIVIIRAANSAHTVVCKDGTGNLKLAGDMSLDNAADTLTLIRAANIWYEIARSNNAA